MTNTESAAARGARAVREILGALDERAVATRIDAPIDRAVRTFTFTWETPFSPCRFHGVIGAFVAHVHAHFDQPAPVAPAGWAEAEAIALLEQGYQGTYESGYDGALLDVINPPEPPAEGIDTVLVNLGEIIKAVQRRRYEEWVYARFTDPFDQDLGRAIVACLLDQFGDDLPEPLVRTRSFELVTQIPYLVETLRNTGSLIRNLQADRLHVSY